MGAGGCSCHLRRRALLVHEDIGSKEEGDRKFEEVKKMIRMVANGKGGTGTLA